jgi:hypothetical protein
MRWLIVLKKKRKLGEIRGHCSGSRSAGRQAGTSRRGMVCVGQWAGRAGRVGAGSHSLLTCCDANNFAELDMILISSSYRKSYPSSTRCGTRTTSGPARQWPVGACAAVREAPPRKTKLGAAGQYCIGGSVIFGIIAHLWAPLSVLGPHVSGGHMSGSPPDITRRKFKSAVQLVLLHASLVCLLQV